MARYYLKKRLNSVDLVEYKVQRGDSYTKIATDTYQDPSKAYSIAYYNDFDPRKPLLTETLLRLPELPQQYLLPRKDISTLEEQAQKAIDEKKFLNAIKIIEKIREEQPGNPRINALSDTAFYNQGMVLLKENNYTAALKYLDKVNPKFKGRKKAVRLAQYHIEQQALDAKLKEAHKLMEKGDYPATITIAEDILSQVPDNQPAKTLSNAARYAWAKLLLEKGKESQAIALLEPIEKGYKDTADLLMQARGKLNARAEAYYRTGVKYFLNEELELAVEAWEKALALNPAHPKAKTDMENARRLLEKWRGFSQDPSSQSTKQPQ
jgi:outer membrane protein assembly factor BamD (BamD/ComL family)